MMNKYFAYDSEEGFDIFNTLAEAQARAESYLSQYQADAGDGWSEEVASVCYGVIFGGAVETERKPWNEHQIDLGLEPSEHPEFDEYVDYEIGPWTIK